MSRPILARTAVDAEDERGSLGKLSIDRLGHSDDPQKRGRWSDEEVVEFDLDLYGLDYPVTFRVPRAALMSALALETDVLGMRVHLTDQMKPGNFALVQDGSL